ncbi:MAG: tetratricopeptide repeat protein [Gammaproteobacteria bacterium]
MTKATLTQIIMFSWLMPTGFSVLAADNDTIASLEGRDVVIPEATLTGREREQALQYYRQYLASPEGDAESRLSAMQRIEELSYESAGPDSPAYAADAIRAEAIVLFEQLLERTDGYEQADVILYQLARTYESVGEFDKALQTLDRLVAEYPASQYLGEAQFRRGEMLFALKSYSASASAYQQVVELGDESTFYEQSMYKLGWAWFKEAEYHASINVLLDLLNLRVAAAEINSSASLSLPESDERHFSAETLAQQMMASAIALEAKFVAMTRAERELVDDTLRALSLMFSYMEGPDTIGTYVDQRGNIDPAYLLYRSLGDLYLQKERFVDAAKTYEAFVAHEPNHFSAPGMSLRAMEAYKEGRFPGKVLEAKRDFVEAYGLETDYWSVHDPAKRSYVIDALKANLTDLAQHDHAEAQRTGDMALYALAAGWYRRFIDYFPDDPESAERSFLLGEILVETGDFAEANQSFLRAAYDYPAYEKAADAAYAALLASRSHYAGLEGEQADLWLAQQLKQGLKYARSFPEHEFVPAVLGDTAETYFERNELFSAVIVAGRLIQTLEHEDKELLRVAWTVVGHGHFDMEHYPRAEKAYRIMRGTSLYGPADDARVGVMTAAELDERIAASIYRQGEQAQFANEVDTAVYHYMRIRDAAPASPIAPQGVYDASALLISSERWLESIDIMLDFRASYPDHEYQNDVTANLAVAYERSAQPLLAAVEYEKVAGFSLDQPLVRREALWSAGELYEEGADVAGARRVWVVFVQDFPQPLAESIEVRQRLADLALKADDIRDRHKWLAEIISVDGTAGEQRTERTKTLAAYAQLELADPKRRAFNAVQLDIPLEQSLKSKKALMEEALEAFGKASGYGIVSVTTAATYRIAELYQRLSQDLLESERPAGLSDEELEMYEILLEEQAFPFEEQAIEVYEVNTSRAANGYYDEWVALSYERLAELMPGRYAKYERAEKQIVELY